MIEKNFDVPFIANLALREKQIQQNFRPVIGVHKWFARRPGTLFRGLLLSEFGAGPLPDIFYRANRLSQITVADPFIGGGTPILEANRLDCHVIGADINPMAYWIVQREIADLDLEEYRDAATRLMNDLKEQMGSHYMTTCLCCGNTQASVKYFIWVKTITCQTCGKDIDLFPGYTLATNARHPQYVIICALCGELNEVDSPKAPPHCKHCSSPLKSGGPARANRCLCSACNTMNKYPQPQLGHPKHRMVAIEYYCPLCKKNHKGRFFKKPDPEDLNKYDQAEALYLSLGGKYVPGEEIPPGDETDRLHRWGYYRYADLFNPRQQLGLEMSCRWIDGLAGGEIKNALATNLSDLLRYQNMLCRYDAAALKSLDIFSVHGFPVGLMQCESNILGIMDDTKGTPVGSGGWLNIVEKYIRAKQFCRQPFELQYKNGRKIQVPITGEWIGEARSVNGEVRKRGVDLRCGSSTTLELGEHTLDAVLTDPPYFANVQYAELMDFCYVWLRKLIHHEPSFQPVTTRNQNELTGNSTMARDLTHFLQGLAQVFEKMAGALKPGAPFIFTYHHNDLNAYLPIAIALLDAGLVCTAALPCPAEMGASIHINGTGSSIVDTVFVCRTTGVVSRKTITTSPEEIAKLVMLDLEKLKAGGVRFSQGDMRCITFGHLIRLAVWFLRSNWDASVNPQDKLEKVMEQINLLGNWPAVRGYLLQHVDAPLKQQWLALEDKPGYGSDQDEISF